MDIVVTVPKNQWADWLSEGNLAGEKQDYNLLSHFWLPKLPTKKKYDDRVYVVCNGKLRGYSLLDMFETRCSLDPEKSCLIRRNTAVAVTIPERIKGFQGFRYRWWDYSIEQPFEDWKEL